MTPEQVNVVAKVTLKLHELGFEAEFQPPISIGPIISVYRYLPKGRTKVTNIESLAADFAVTLGVEDVFVKRLPGETSVGVYVPNKDRKWVPWTQIVNEVWSHKAKVPVPLGFGVTHLGEPFVEDLTALPHLLIAGSTGSGKSILLSAMIASIVYTVNSSEVKFVLSDSKHGAEFGYFAGSPHLLFEPATSVYQTMEQLDWILSELDDRMKSIAKASCRNIKEYHERGFKMPFIVIVLDELADLLSFRVGKRNEKVAEEKLQKIVQKSRATGIHMIAATQRPDVKVVSGTIKANFPARLSLRLPTSADSKTVLGTGGAEHLLSKGDMLYVSPNRPGMQRLHAPWVELRDIEAAVDMSVQREKLRQEVSNGS